MAVTDAEFAALKGRVKALEDEVAKIKMYLNSDVLGGFAVVSASIAGLEEWRAKDVDPVLDDFRTRVAAGELTLNERFVPAFLRFITEARSFGAVTLRGYYRILELADPENARPSSLDAEDVLVGETITDFTNRNG